MTSARRSVIGLEDVVFDDELVTFEFLNERTDLFRVDAQQIGEVLLFDSLMLKDVFDDQRLGKIVECSHDVANQRLENGTWIVGIEYRRNEFEGRGYNRCGVGGIDDGTRSVRMGKCRTVIVGCSTNTTCCE